MGYTNIPEETLAMVPSRYTIYYSRVNGPFYYIERFDNIDAANDGIGWDQYSEEFAELEKTFGVKLLIIDMQAPSDNDTILYASKDLPQYTSAADYGIT